MTKDMAKLLATGALIFTSVAAQASSLAGVDVTLRASDNLNGANPYFSITTTVGSGIEGRAFFLNDTISEFVDISDTQILFGLSFSANAVAALPVPHFWTVEFQAGTNVTPLLEVSDTLPSGADIASSGNDNVTLRLNPFSTMSGPFTQAAIYSVTVTPVPEPSTYALFLAGIALVCFAGRRRQPRARPKK